MGNRIFSLNCSKETTDIHNLLSYFKQNDCFKTIRIHHGGHNILLNNGSDAGTYEIHVSNPGNNSKYSLAIGEIEAFDMKEGLSALTLIPEIKKNFFNESPIGFIISPFGWGLIVGMYFLSFIFGFVYRYILKHVAKSKVRQAHKNIGKNDRLLRLVIGLGLLLWAITTTWSPILIFLSGFALFEAIFSWCGLYAALGKNSCPITG